MSWAENKKLDEWIQRAYENGKREEQERIVELLETHVGITGMFGLERDDVIALIKGESQKDNENVVILTEGENK